NSEFVSYQDNYGAIGCNFIGCVPEQQVIVMSLQNAVAAVNRGDRDIHWLATGAGLLTRCFARACSASDRQGRLNRSSILPLYELQRHVGVHCPTFYKLTPGGRNNPKMPRATVPGPKG